MGVTSACGEAEIRAVCSPGSFFLDFFAAVARRGVWRLPVFFVEAGASDPDAGCFTSSAVFVFFGTDVQWLE